MSFCLWLWGTKVSKALNLYLSIIGLSQVSVSSLTYFIVQKELKILCLVIKLIQKTKEWSTKDVKNFSFVSGI